MLNKALSMMGHGTIERHGSSSAKPAMPKKLSTVETIPTLILERLTVWGRIILAERLRRRITVADLCHRIGISEATLRRVERGDPGASAGTYLTALMALGLLDDAAPPPPQSLSETGGQRRVRLSKEERGGAADYF